MFFKPKIRYSEHIAALRDADQKFADERDRRYSEVKAAEEKAIRVKEKADEVALGLARDSSNYREQRDNRLREQIESERGDYATKSDLLNLSEKFDAANEPVIKFMAAYGGKAAQSSETRLNINLVVGVIALLVALGILYATFHH